MMTVSDRQAIEHISKSIKRRKKYIKRLKDVTNLEQIECRFSEFAIRDEITKDKLIISELEELVKELESLIGR